jgi:3-oxoacyl-[acyl-carrier-protein] synthase-3
MRNAIIVSSGASAPDNIVPNAYFDDLLGVNVSDWLEEFVKIYNRRWATENQSTSDLAYEAATECLQGAKLDPKDVDLIILATDTPEYISPSTASVLQHKLGCLNAGTF